MTIRSVNVPILTQYDHNTRLMEQHLEHHRGHLTRESWKKLEEKRNKDYNGVPPEYVRMIAYAFYAGYRAGTVDAKPEKEQE